MNFPSVPHTPTRFPEVLVGRLAVTLLSAYYFLPASLHPEEWRFLDSVDLIIHEAGHTLFFWSGEFLQILMGSGLQVLVPLLFLGYFFIRKEFFSSALVLFWVALSLNNVSVYMADALAMQLPLLGGEGVIHDWAYLAEHTGLGVHMLTFASGVHGVSILLTLLAVWWSLALCVKRSEIH